MFKTNEIKKYCKLGLLAMLVFFVEEAKAQSCTGCKTVITANTSASITIGSGDVVCINPGVVVSGNITLNGGTLCNQGIVNNLTLIEGIFENRGSFSKPTGNLNISNAKNLKIICYPHSSFDLSNAMNMDALTNSDSIVIDVYGGAKFSIGKNVAITKGWLKLTNAIEDPSLKTPVASVLNIGGQLNISNSALKILNLPKGIFNVTGAVNIDGKHNKVITNYGLFNSNNSFNISGNGQGASVTLNNNGSFNITGNLTSSYNNGTVTINNNNYPIKPQPTFVVKKSITLSKADNVFNNYRPLDVTQDINLEKGSFINYSTVIARDIDVKQGTLTNYNQINALRDFNITNLNGVVNNNSYIDAAGKFDNIGTFNMGLSSFLRTNNYFNLNTGTINGPASIADDSEYAKIFIAGNSNNTGYINGKVLVYDNTLVGTANNNGYGFDQVNNASRISGNTNFAAKSVGPGPPISINCLILQSIFSVQASGSPTTVCPGAPVNLTSQFSQKVTFTIYFFPSGSFTFTFYIPVSIPASSYAWIPGPLLPAGPNHVVNPTASTIYTVNVTFAGCTFSNTVNVTVLPTFAVNISSNVTPICYQSVPPLLFSSAVTPAQPGATYQWYLNGVAVTSGGTSPAFNPASAGNYYLKVTSTSGCSANSNTLTANPSPTVNVTTSAAALCTTGSTALLTANLLSGSGTITNYQWQFNTANVGTNSPNHTASAGGNYAVTVTNNFGCTVIGNITINSSVGLAADAGFDQFFVSGNVTLGGSPTAIGGVGPYTYNWTPNTGCVTSGCNTTSNPVVAPSLSTLYTVLVTDANSCTATDQVMVTNLTSNISYAVPKKNIDGGYHVPVSNKVYFKFEEEYRTSILNYKIFDYSNTTLNTAPVNVACTNLISAPKNLGDNRYFIDLSTCTGIAPAKYYLMEITNDKSEKFYLKFKN